MKTKAEKLISVKKQIKEAKKFIDETRIKVMIKGKIKELNLEEFYQYKKEKWNTKKNI